MTEDARLSDFLPSEDDDGEDEESVERETPVDGPAEGDVSDEPQNERGGGEETGTDEGPSGDDERIGEDDAETEPAESAVSTYAWGEYTCDRCDEATTRVWRADGALVCPACKPW